MMNEIVKQTRKQHEGIWHCCMCNHDGTLYDYKGLGVLCKSCLEHVERIVKRELSAYKGGRER